MATTAIVETKNMASPALTPASRAARRRRVTVVDVWENEDSFQAFGPTIGPALVGAGLDAKPRIHKVEATMGADGKRVTY